MATTENMGGPASVSYGAPSLVAQQHTYGHVLCCLCGASIMPNPSNMCVNCIRSQVDITAGLQKQVTVLWCKECNRYLNPPKNWVRAELESKELLTFCVKRIKGLQKVKLVDAGFIWTEPHSRRLKTKLTVQSEVFNGAILQQTFVVEYVVETHMCPDCSRAAANPNTWTAVVQVRQHTEHKRTFMFLEQVILKYNAAAACINIKDIHEGVDFFFSKRSHAQRFLDFLQGVVPIRYRSDKQLVSHNEQNASYNYKYTFSVEIVPICKDDLIFLPSKVSSSVGHLGPLVLCTRAMNTLHYIEPNTLRGTQVEAPVFWRQPYKALLNSRHLVEYMILDIEPTGQTAANGKIELADAQVARVADLGSNDTTYHVRTHLGHLLNPGDTALGYDMTRANFVDDELENYVQKGHSLPDVVLVRKSYEERRRKRQGKGQGRSWKLKRMAIDSDDTMVLKKGQQAQADKRQQDLERFMQELEEDPEMRSRVALYKDPAHKAAAAQKMDAMTDGDDDEDDLPDIPLEELLDDMNALQLEEGAQHSTVSDEDEDMEG